MNYGIKLQSCNRHIVWCDKHWYETDNGACYPFASLQEALDAIKQLVDHYVFHVTLVSSEGQVDYDFGKKRIQPAAVPVAPKQISGLKLGDFSLF